MIVDSHVTALEASRLQKAPKLAEKEERGAEEDPDPPSVWAAGRDTLTRTFNR